MPVPDKRLRTPPAERFAGIEHLIDLESALVALRKEPAGSANEHRQITIFRRGSLRLVLFAFEAGGRLTSHRAPGFVVIQALRGSVRVSTSATNYDLNDGQMVVLDPDVEHEVEALEQADILLTVSVAR